MSHIVSVPTLDHTGKLSPLVREAIAKGATSTLDPADPHSTLVITFSKAADAKAFKAKVANLDLATAARAVSEKFDEMLAIASAWHDTDDQPDE